MILYNSMDAFELWCLRRLLRVPWTTRRSDQSVLKEINPEYSLEGLMLKLRLQYTLATWIKEPTYWKRPWLWERLKSGGKGGDRGWDGLMVSPTQWTWIWATLGNGEGQGKLACCSPWDSQESSPNHSSKASILQHSAFFTVQLSHPYMTTGKTIAWLDGRLLAK